MADGRAGGGITRVLTVVELLDFVLDLFDFKWTYPDMALAPTHQKIAGFL